MRVGSRNPLLLAGGAVGLIAAAGAPVALRGVAGGRWDVSRSATGQGATRLCVADPAALAQFEHRGQACTRVLLSDEPGKAVIHYTCAAGDFGRTTITVITPRTLRLKAQGIRRGEPFDSTLHARRTAPC